MTKELIRKKFPKEADKIIAICEIQASATVDSFQTFLDLEEVLGMNEAINLLANYTTESLDQLEELGVIDEDGEE